MSHVSVHAEPHPCSACLCASPHSISRRYPPDVSKYTADDSAPYARMQRQLAGFSGRLCDADPLWSQVLGDWQQPPAQITEFVTSPIYLDLGGEVYPQVLDTLQELFSGGYSEAALCWGIGSGKSWLAALALMYMAHRVLCLRDPQAHFRLSPGSQIALVIMGPSSRQVRSVIFADIAALIRRSPWFQRNFPPAATRADSLDLPKNVTITAGNSADTAVLGYNVLAAVIDEAAWLTETLDGRRQSADDIYTALQRRIKSRFGDRGMLLMVSSPRHSSDFIMSKLAEAEQNPRIYASQKPVWDVKPPDRFCGRRFEHRGLSVPIEYQPEFQRDPHKAMRDLAAQPQGAWHGLFPDMEPLYAACDDSLRHPVIEERLGLAEWFRAPDSRPRYIHVDLGLRHDACGIAMAVAEDENTRRKSARYATPHTRDSGSDAAHSTDDADAAPDTPHTSPRRVPLSYRLVRTARTPRNTQPAKREVVEYEADAAHGTGDEIAGRRAPKHSRPGQAPMHGTSQPSCAAQENDTRLEADTAELEESAMWRDAETAHATLRTRDSGSEIAGRTPRHRQPWRDADADADADTQRDAQPCADGVSITVELMAQITPPPGGEIDLAQVRSFILALRERGFVIGGVSYDGYQSADSRQILQRRGLPVKIISVDRDMARYQMLRELAHERRLRLYHYKPFLEEAAQLEVIRQQRVDHPRGGSKDVTDAVAGAVSEALLAGHGATVKGRVV